MSRVLFSLLAFSVLLGGCPRASAQATGGFSIRAVIPDNQIDRKQTYFDLRMVPGNRQTLQVVITNSRGDPMTALVRLNAAATGRNGTVVYTEPGAKTHSGLSISDVAALSAQEVLVPAHGTQTVEIHLSMPDSLPEGILLGGIAVSERPAGEQAEAGQGITLENTITYVIALKLTMGESMPAIDFSLQSTVPGLVNYRTAVVATLRNLTARLVKGMEVNAAVFRKGAAEPLHSLSLSSADMAPATDGEFVIDWGGRPLKPGVYRLFMTVDHEGRHWEWDEEFTISGNADALNKEAIGQQPESGFHFWLLWIAVLIGIGLFAYWLGTRRRRREA